MFKRVTNSPAPFMDDHRPRTGTLHWARWVVLSVVSTTYFEEVENPLIALKGYDKNPNALRALFGE